MFLATIASHRKELCSTVHGLIVYIQLIKTHRCDIHVYLDVTLRSRYMRSTGDIDLMRLSYTYSDAYNELISMFLSFLL